MLHSPLRVCLDDVLEVLNCMRVGLCTDNGRGGSVDEAHRSILCTCSYGINAMFALSNIFSLAHARKYNNAINAGSINVD